MMSWYLVISRAIGTEFQKNFVVAIENLKEELIKSSSSLKATFEAISSLEEESRRFKVELDSV